MAMAPTIGRWVRREDGAPKVTGRTVYTGDLKLPGLLHARLVLSPYPHARIVSIDAEAARALPGVVGVYTADDLPLTEPKGLTRSRQPLARERVLLRRASRRGRGSRERRGCRRRRGACAGGV